MIFLIVFAGVYGIGCFAIELSSAHIREVCMWSIVCVGRFVTHFLPHSAICMYCFPTNITLALGEELTWISLC